MSDPGGPPIPISLRELFDLIAARIAETDPPYDVEAGLARLQAWIEAGEPAGPDEDLVDGGGTMASHSAAD